MTTVDVTQQVVEVTTTPTGVTLTVSGAQGPQGSTGATGAAGAAGADGSVWRDGSGAPSNGLGADGDFYLDTDTGDVYAKAGGAYALVMTISGGGGAVDSVNGQTGVVSLAASDVGAYSTAEVDTLLASYLLSSDFTFANLTGKPTTLAGYGITDAVDGSGSAGAFAVWSDSNTLTKDDSIFLAAPGEVVIDGQLTVNDLDVTNGIPQSQVATLVSDLAAKAPLASPTFTGTPAAPTAAGGTNTTQVATTAFVTSAVSAHEADTTSVHGIADTSALLTSSAAAAAYQPLDSDLTAIAALTTTTYGRSVLEAANAAALRTLAGVVIGTDVQAYNANLAALAGLTSAANKGIQFTGSGTAATFDLTAAAKTVLDDTTTGAMLTTLGAAPSGADYITESAQSGLSAEVLTTTLLATGTYASLPAATKAGRIYLPSDSPYIFRDNGSAQEAWGPIRKLTVPPSSGWSWDNQGAITLDSTGGALVFTSSTANNNLGLYYRTAPGTPYVITALWRMPAWAMTGNASIGIGFRQSSDGKIHAFRLQQNSTNANVNYISDKWTNSTTFSANYTSSATGLYAPGLLWLRIADNGTNRICSISNTGVAWRQFDTIGRTDFLTADQIAIVVRNSTAQQFDAELLSWAVT